MSGGAIEVIGTKRGWGGGGIKMHTVPNFEVHI